MPQLQIWEFHYLLLCLISRIFLIWGPKIIEIIKDIIQLYFIDYVSTLQKKGVTLEFHDLASVSS